MHISFIIFKSLTWIEVASEALTRLRGFAYGKVDFPMGAWCQGFDFP